MRVVVRTPPRKCECGTALATSVVSSCCQRDGVEIDAFKVMSRRARVLARETSKRDRCRRQRRTTCERRAKAERRKICSHTLRKLTSEKHRLRSSRPCRSRQIKSTSVAVGDAHKQPPSKTPLPHAKRHHGQKTHTHQAKVSAGGAATKTQANLIVKPAHRTSRR